MWPENNTSDSKVTSQHRSTRGAVVGGKTTFFLFRQSVERILCEEHDSRYFYVLPSVGWRLQTVKLDMSHIGLHKCFSHETSISSTMVVAVCEQRAVFDMITFLQP